MPADNQLGDHDDLWSYCFPEGIVNAASPHIFDFNALDMVQIFQLMLMVISWYKTEIAHYFHTHVIFSRFYY